MRARPAVFVILIWVVLSGSAAGTEAHAADGSVAPTVLADLAPEVIAELEKVEPDSGFPSDPGQQLQRVFEASPAYRFADAGVVVYTDRRWYSTTSVVGPRAPLLELRRWPGDSVLAVYAVRRSDGAGPGGEGPPIEKGSFVPAPGFVPGGAAWQGTVETPAGERPAIWLESSAVDPAHARLGVLLLPGDAGFGQAGVASLTEELRAVVGRIDVRPEDWGGNVGIAAGESIELPTVAEAPGAMTEEDSPWQVVQGPGFTVGLPPGCRARRIDGNVPPPRPVPGGSLWIRGRFVDTEGERVAIGDGDRFGYVAEVRPATDAWADGGDPPLGAPGAERRAHQSFSTAAEQTGAIAAIAERWKEPGFAGDWLVFRLRFEEAGIEIGLPVLAGRRSESLFWIPLTWRDADRPPAPPPVDPAERFGIRFDRLRPSERRGEPWTEGHLIAPGLRMDLPTGWSPSVALRSDDGYPIQFVDDAGVVLGQVDRLEPQEAEELLASESEWKAAERRGRHGAAAIHESKSGRLLFVAREGHAFLLTREESDEEETGGTWLLTTDSVRLVRPEGVKPRSDPE